MSGTLDVSEALKRYRILGASAVAVSCPADTTEDILGTINVPAGAMGLNGILRIRTHWTFTGSVNAKNWRIRLGGIGGALFLNNGDATLTDTDFWADTMIQNVGSAAIQKGYSRGITNVSSLQVTSKSAGAIDTSVAQTTVITGQKATAGETLTLESYLVELLRPDLGLA